MLDILILATVLRSAPIPVAVSAVDAWANTTPPVLHFEARKIASTNFLAAVYGSATCPPPSSPVRYSWSVAPATILPYAGTLPAPDALLPEGDYIMSCWTGSEAFDPGEPYGCAKFAIPATGDVARVAIELTDVHAGMPRIDLATGACDRSLWGIPWAGAAVSNLLSTADGRKTVDIWLDTINGSGVSPQKIFSRTFEKGERPILTEADLIAATGDFDLGWGTIVRTYLEAGANNRKDLTNAVFSARHKAELLVEIETHYEWGGRPNQATNLTVTICGQTPMVRWNHHPEEDSAPCPACQIKIFSDSGFTNPIWDSGIIQAPPRDADGLYCVPLPAEVIPPSGVTWYMRVSMNNAKFYNLQNNNYYNDYYASSAYTSDLPEVSVRQPLSKRVALPVSVTHFEWRETWRPVLNFSLRRQASTDALKAMRGLPLMRPAPAATWRVETVRGFPFAATLPAPEAALPVGDYILECWTGDEAFDPGEPYGCAQFSIPATGNVERIEVELAEVNASMPRIDLATGACDRNVWGIPWAGAAVSNLLSTADGRATVEIWLDTINGRGVRPQKMFSRTFEKGERPIMTEADMLAGLKTLDLGWDTLVASYLEGGAGNPRDLTNAVFGIIFKVGPSAFEDENNLFAVEIENHYERGKKQSPVSDMAVENSHGRPVFTWRHENDIGNNVAKAYPAFQLRIWENDGETIVYDSGALRAPVRDNSGVYRWTAPIVAASVLDAGTEYLWAVSMLDAKFPAPLELDSSEPGVTCGQFTFND